MTTSTVTSGPQITIERVREPSLIDQAVNEKVASVYQYTAMAFAASCATAVVSAGIRLPLVMLSSPGMLYGSMIGLTAVSVGLIWATLKTAKENISQKHLLYGLFSVCEGLALSPLVLINPVAFGAAALATVAVTGALGVAATRLKESFERYEKILMVGLGAIALCSLSAVFFGGAVGAVAHQVSLVGGMALFSAFVIFDTHKARTAARNHPEQFDAVNHSIGVYLDAVNLLVRFWEIFDKRK